jgi:hypothetical protein
MFVWTRLRRSAEIHASRSGSTPPRRKVPQKKLISKVKARLSRSSAEKSVSPRGKTKEAGGPILTNRTRSGRPTMKTGKSTPKPGALPSRAWHRHGGRPPLQRSRRDVPMMLFAKALALADLLDTA